LADGAAGFRVPFAGVAVGVGAESEAGTEAGVGVGPVAGVAGVAEAEENRDENQEVCAGPAFLAELFRLLAEGEFISILSV
jgi:hypothetical protein